MKVSVIIPSYNDNYTINTTVQSLLNHNHNIHEIIIVDDFSDTPVQDIIQDFDRRIRVFRTEQNGGVGKSFDFGVSCADGDVLYLMGADIRFDSNDAVDEMCRYAYQEKDQLVSCGCIGVTDNINFERSTNVSDNGRMGASIKWKITNDDLSGNNPLSKDYSYRDIIQAKWLREKPNQITTIPCILGATYAVSKEWYLYLKGFQEHRTWGGLEPMISIKSHLSGGGCKIMPDVYTGHMFGRGVSKRNTWDMYFNKVYMAYMFFDEEVRDELLDHVKVWKNPMVAEKEILERWGNYFSKQKKYYNSIFKKDVRDTILWDTWV